MIKFGLSHRVLQKIQEVLLAFPAVNEAVIYGSRAMDNYREGSDIDLTLKGEVSFKELLQIEKALDDKMLPYTFDLSLYDSIQNEDLVEHIDRVGKILYEKKPVGDSPKV